MPALAAQAAILVLVNLQTNLDERIEFAQSLGLHK